MSKRITKIICAILAAVVALGILLISGCTEGHTDNALGGSGIFTDDKAQSNGGFAVVKGNYIYFINGVQGNTASNEYGKPVKGAISRISKENFAARNYSKTDIVVPQIVYSGNHNAGIFIYGNEVYYGTPSTTKNGEGAVQNENLEMQSTKLDRSVTSAPYIRFPDSSYEYRFVEVEGTVYLLYVATNESLYSESTGGVTNLHSLNTKTGKNTLLAYNVDTVLFDGEDKTNHRVYYTMNVRNYADGNNYGYNQVYTVTADVTTANEYDTSSIIGWDKDEDRYINCGELVFEGIGGKNVNKTPFNYLPDDATAINKNDSFTYSLSVYQNNTLFFTRSNEYNSGQYLYSYKDGAIKDTNPVKINEDITDTEILKDGSSATSYKYIFDGENLKGVLKAESDGGISVNYVDENGKLGDKKSELEGTKYFNIVKEGTATLLFLDTENTYLYYSVSGDTNGYSVWRINYDSTDIDDYDVSWKPEPTSHSPVQVKGVDAVSDWYMPEIIENQLLYANAANDMTLYTYIMAYDLRNKNTDELMTNAELRDIEKLYDEIETTIQTYADTNEYPSDDYQNIQEILHYAFYTADLDSAKAHQKKVNADVEDGGVLPFSDKSLEAFEQFITPAEGGKWAEFTDTKQVNGKSVYANTRDYYFCLLGKMSSSDESAYKKALISTYLPQYDEPTVTWWESLGDGGRAGFIIGMVVAGLVVIGGVTVLVIFLVKRKKKGGSTAKRRRIKVDTTDDKSIDVYNN